MVAKFDLLLIVLFIGALGIGLLMARTLFDYFSASVLGVLVPLSVINLRSTAESKSMIREEVLKIRERFGHLLD